MNPTLKLLAGHRSVRKFEPGPLAEATVRADVAEFDGRMAEYYARRGLAGRDWSGGVSRKLAKANRATLSEFYRSQGAELD